METQPAGPLDPGSYEIQLQGRIDERWSTWFDGMTLSTDASGCVTVLRGPVVDQAALHGVLARLRDLGLPLISVTRVDPHPADGRGPGSEGER